MARVPAFQAGHASSILVIRSIGYGQHVVCVAVSMDRTAVPIGSGHMFKYGVIRHIIDTIDEHGRIKARCGVTFNGASGTWQTDRPCARCKPSGEGWCVTIGARETQAHMPGGLEGLRHYCLQALEGSQSKALSRAVDPPETILVERPDLKEQIVYHSPAMEKQHDRSRKFSKPSPF